MVEASLVNYAELGILAIGIIIALQQLRDIKKTREIELETRQAQLFMQIYDRFNDREFWEYFTELRSHTWDDVEDWQMKYGREENRKAFSAFASMASYFDGVGVLANRELIDIGLVDDLLHTRALWFWDTYEDIIREMRTRNNNPRIWPYIESLHSQIQGYEKQL
jgi:hypothetical protein